MQKNYQIKNRICITEVRPLYKTVAVFALSILTFFTFSSPFALAVESTFTTSLTTTGLSVLPPPIPTNFTATAVSDKQIDLSWSASTPNYYPIAGYRIFRDSVILATTTSTIYSDTGLTQLTGYSYTVEAFDTLFQMSGQSATSTATTTATPLPSPSPSTGGGGSSGGGATGMGIIISNIKIIPETNQAEISFTTNVPTQTKIQWGFSNDYEIGSLQNLFYGYEHTQIINGLVPGLTYQVRITANDSKGVVVYKDLIFSTILPITEIGPLPNPADFLATAKEKDIELTWKNPTDPRFNDVRIVRTEGFYPIDQFDGIPLYEGDGESFVDTTAIPGVTYYYAIFSRDRVMEYSSGALAQARIAIPGEPVVASITDPFANLPQAKDVDPMIKALTLADFEFIQDGKLLEVVGETVAISGDKNLTIRLRYNKVPEILKTVAFTLQDPNDKSKVFPFLLRVNNDKSYYEATIGALGRSGRYGMSVVILDYQNNGLMRLNGTLAALAFTAPLFDFGKNFDLFGLLILFLLILLLILAIILLRKLVDYSKKSKYTTPVKIVRPSIANGKFIASIFIFVIAQLFIFNKIPNAFAAYNPEINYQGKLVTSTNSIVPDGNYNIRFKLYTSRTGGSPIWTETWCNTSDCAGTGTGTDDRIAISNGLFSTMLGSTTALTGIDFNQPLYLGVEIGGSGATAVWDGEMSPRKILGAVPAAFYAGTSTVALSANTLDGLNSSQFFRTDAQNATSSASTFLNVIQTGAGKIAEFFGSASQSVLALLSNGNVGIGTTTPYAKLSVAGEVVGQNFTATSTTATSTFAGGLSVAGATGLNILQNGNVGIGTTNPGSKLEVVGDIISKGTSWTARSAAGNDDGWYSVTYGNGLFVAVGLSGDRVMTSPDGINWTARSAAGNDDGWYDITYGNGLFVAVGISGDRVMTSPDGINWTVRSAAGNDDSWRSVTYGNGLFVAVGLSGDRVMTSPDGINWTVRSAAGNDDSWYGVTYGNGLFVAVSYVNDRVMTSSDGINWTVGSAAGDNDGWLRVTYGNGLFVAVSFTGGDRVMTSSDGINWTARSAAGDDDSWSNVTYGNGLFVATGYVGYVNNDRVMTSPDGINWTVRSAAGDNDDWLGVTYGNGLFVAVGNSGDRVMTSGKLEQTQLAHNNVYQGGMNIFGNVGIGTSTPGSILSIDGIGNFASTGSTLYSTITAPYFTATTSTASTFPYASTTALTVSGTNGLQLASGLNGLLQAVNGLVQSSSTLSVAYGGTGLSTAPTYGQLLVGNASSGYTLTSTSSLGIALSSIVGNFGKSWEITNNIFSESSLSPTTTQNIAISGTGTSTFAGGLEAWRQISSPYFHATSTTATSTFAGGMSVAGATGLNILQNGNVGIGTTSASSKLTLAGGNFTHTASGNPTLAGAYNPSGDAYDVYVSGKYAYVADEDSGLQIIDISNPTNPTLTGTYDTSGSSYGVYVSGKYAYVGDWFSGLQIIDISNPTNPTLTGTYDTNGTAYGVYVSGKYAYVADGNSGIQIIDISNPANQTLTGTYDTSGNANGVYVSGKYAYVADGNAGLQIIDISNPTNPTLTGTYDTSGTAYKVYVSGKYAYVADSGSGLQIIDISNPTNPTLTGTYDTSGSSYGVYVSGKYAYVADNDSGLQVIDISSSTVPVLVGTYDTSGYAYKVYVSGKYAYVADSTSGLQIIDINGIETPSLYAGNIATNDLTVTENIDVGNSLFVRNGLNVGTGGIFTDGVLSVTGTSSSYIAGNLGIGTTSPNWKLSVTGIGSFDDYVRASYFNATSTTATSTFPNLSLTRMLFGSDYLTDITGAGLSITNNALTVTGASILGAANMLASFDSSGNLTSTSSPQVAYINATSTTNKSYFAGGINVSGTTGGYYIDNNLIFQASSTNFSTLVGQGAGSALRTDGINNTALGYQALYVTASGDYNTSVGYQSLYSNTSSYNSAQGVYSLYSNTTGSNNSAQGYGSLYLNTTGSYNSVSGVNSFFSNITGSNNVGVGYFTSRYNQSATNTTAVGYNAGAGTGNYYNQGGVYLGYQAGYSASTGSDYNTMLGYQSGYLLTTGSHNILIGQNVQATSTNSVGGLNIGNVLFGTGMYTGSAVSSTATVDGKIGIGTTSPNWKLSVTGIGSFDDYVRASYFNATSTTATSTFAGGMSVAGATGLNILQNGNVGIGTTSVSSKLTLAGGNFTHTASGNPTLAGTYDTSGDVRTVYVSGKYAYVADWGSGLQIIDISNPISPVLKGTYDTSGNAYGVYVSGKYAYVADWGSGLQIIDISNPVNPILTGTYNTSGSSSGVYVSGKYAYVGDDSSGLQIIDISNPSNPILTGTYNTSGNAYNVYVSGKYAYVGDGVSGLQIIDISNPSSPTLTGTYNTSGTAYGVYVSGKYAYVGDDTSGLQIIDISNPSSPTLTGTYNTSGTSYGVFVSGKYSYIADGTFGLQIIDINGIETPSLYAGNINTNDLTVTENIDVGNNLFVRNGLNVGTGGIFTDGVLSVTGTSSSYIAGNLGLATTSPWRTLSVNGSSDLGTNALAGYFTATTSTASTFPYASTTALTVSGTNGLQLATGLNGPLQANNGLVSATTSIGVLYGGTGLTTAPSYGQLLLGNASSGYTLSATSSLGLLGSTTISSLTANYIPKWNTSTFANSLIYDNGTNVGIGTTSPYAKLSLHAGATDTYNPILFSIASSTSSYATSTLFTVLANGNVGVGTSNPGSKLEVVGDIISKGTSWTARSAAGDNDQWRSVVHGNGLFVAVIRQGTESVITSSDGINWTAHNAAGDDDEWFAITYGNGLFVAVGDSGDRVMTSPDGINWTARSAAGNDDYWQNVTYGNGLFVAVGQGNDRVMTSPDGINWTARSAAGDDDSWFNVTYGNGLFVAVGNSGDRVMTSPDGINWTARSAAGDNDAWYGVTYGSGLFVAVGNSGDRVMTSPDGINWTARSAAGDNDAWYSITYGSGLFVAVSYSGDRVMTSPDGINWTARSAADDNDNWLGVTYGNGLFVAVGDSGDRVMTSGKLEQTQLAHNNTYQGGMNIFGNLGLATTSPWRTLSVNGSSDLGNNALAGYFTATTSTASTFPYASTTALTVSGTDGLQLATGLNGPLQANNGLVSATTSIGVLYGGTGLSTAPTYGQLLVGDGAGNYSLAGTSTLGILASSAIGLGSQGFIPYYASGAQALTATSSLFISQDSFIGIGTTTPTSVLSVFSASAPQFQLAYDKDNYLKTSVSSSGGVTMAVSGSLGGFAITNSQPTAVQTGTGTDAPLSFSVTGGIGGNSLDTNAAVGGIGGGIQLNAGVGGTVSLATVSETAGAGGTITVNGGAGGNASAPSVDFMTRVAGAGGALTFAGGTGGNASNGGLISSNTAGAGGVFILKGGTGGNASGATTNNGGAGGSLYLSGGAGGTGSTANGNAGNLYLGYDSLSSIGNVYFGNQNVSYIGSTGNLGLSTTSPFAKLSVTNTSTTQPALAVYGFNSQTSPLMLVASTTGSATSTAFIIDSNGKVGIGTASPSQELSVAGNGSFTGNLTLGTLNGPLQANNGLVSATTSIGVLYGGTGLTTAPSYGQLLLGNASSGYTLSATSSLGLLGSTTVSSLTANYIPKWNTSTFANSLLYDNGTNVGIGTTNPLAPLHVVGLKGLQIDSGNGGGGLILGADVNATTKTSGARKLARIVMPAWDAGATNVMLFSGDIAASGYSNDVYFGGTPGGSQYAATGIHFVTGVSTTTTGGIEKLTIDNNGNVGIGTTSPYAKLSVFGASATVPTFALTGYYNQTSPLMLVASTTGSATSTAFIIDSNGKVGIGTTSPFTQLSVQGGVAGQYLNADSSTATSTFAGGLSVAGTSGLTVLQNGRVGVGTITPQQELQVNGTFRSQALSASDNIWFEGYNSAGTAIANMKENSGAGSGGLLFQGWRNGNNGDGVQFYGLMNGGRAALYFNGASASSLSGAQTDLGTTIPIAIFANNLSEKMRIGSDGSVGLSTTSPYAKLSVTNTSTTQPALAVYGFNSQTSPLMLVASTTGSATSTAFIIDSNGNVGVNTSNPSHGLFEVEATSFPKTLVALNSSTANWGIGMGAETVPNLYFGQSTNINTNYFWRGNWNTANVAASTFQAPDINNNAITVLEILQKRSGNTGDYLHVTSNGATTGNILNLTNSGNLGIGTTTPGAKLHALGTTEQLRLGYDQSKYASFTVSSGGDLAVATSKAQLIIDGDTAAGPIIDYDVNSSGVTTLTAFRFGNGTIPAGASSGTYTNMAMTPTINTSGTHGWRMLYINPQITAEGSGSKYLIQTQKANTDQFTVSDVGVGYFAGNLGLATTSPFAKLSVTNTSTTQPALAVYGFNSQTSPLMLVASTTGSATSTAFIIDQNGLVGIGTTTPYTQLSVQGGIAGQYLNADSSTATSTFAGGMSVAGTSGLTVLQNGDVGVGTTKPNYKLDITGSMRINTGALYLVGVSNYATIQGSGTNADIIAQTIGNYDFRTYTNSTYNSKLYISSTGLVGISSTSPYAKLSIHAGATDTYNPTLFSIASSTSAYATSTLFTVLANGKVGVGTAAPSQKLHVYVPSGDVYQILETGQVGSLTVGQYLNTGSVGWFFGQNKSVVGNNFEIVQSLGGTTGTKLIIQKDTGNLGLATTSPYAKLSIHAGATDTYNPTLFSIASSTSAYATSTLFTVLANGNVGVGKIPSYKLDIAGSINAQNSLVGDDIWIQSGSKKAIGYSGSNIIFGNHSSLTGMLFYPGSTEVFRATNTGLFGIGTTSPYAKLSVVGTDAASTTLAVYGFNSQTSPLMLVASTTGSATSTAFIIDSNGKVGIGTTTPSAILGLSGNMYLSGTATSTIEGNLDVKSTLHALTSYTGDLFFANNFSFTEALPINGTTTQALYLKNQNGNKVMDIDDNGNLNITGDICAKNVACVNKSIDKLSADLNALASSTIGLQDGINGIKNTSSSVQSLADAIVALDLKVEALIASSTINTDLLISSTSIALASSTDFINKISSSTATVLNSDTGFIGSIASAVKNILSSAQDWVVDRFTAKVAYINRVEAETVAISKGMEIVDQVSGATWCVTIKNGDWNKVMGTCASLASTTPVITPAPVVLPTPVIPIDPAPIIPVVNQISTTTSTPTLDFASSTPKVEISASSSPAIQNVVTEENPPSIPTTSPETISLPIITPEVSSTPVTSTDPVSVPAQAPVVNEAPVVSVEAPVVTSTP